MTFGSLVDEEVASDAVGHDGEGQAGDERGQAEEQRDARAQTKRASLCERHGHSVPDPRLLCGSGG